MNWKENLKQKSYFDYTQGANYCWLIERTKKKKFDTEQTLKSSTQISVIFKNNQNIENIQNIFKNPQKYSKIFKNISSVKMTFARLWTFWQMDFFFLTGWAIIFSTFASIFR